MSAFLGITREPVFSPGRVHDDAAILEMTADCLRRRGHTVNVFSADDREWPTPPRRDVVVFTMCQGTLALERLRQWQGCGVRIVNSPEGILNCQRHRTVALLTHTPIAFPETVLVDTATDPTLPPWVDDGGAWVKRGDVHATEADDVVAVDSGAATRQALRRMQARGVERAVVQRHVAGMVLKFYAVRGRFFHCVPPPGGEKIAAEVACRIDELGQRAAQILGVDVYGGDCVYDAASGAITLIDLNDWPSYAPCRAAAATAIAAHLLAHNVATDT